ncbi:MAG: tetratricopeptide repeat protein [Ignavibacteria bacterium]|nr:tetratricopeptide repeat protein [Ignavibacteria bacterium]
MKKIVAVFLTCMASVCISSISYAQNQHAIDSLQAILKTSTHDTVKVNMLCLIAREYWDYTPDRSMEYARQALAIAEKIDYKRGMGNAYHVMSVLDTNNIAAIELEKKALKYRQEINDEDGINNSLFSMANSYQGLGDYVQSLKYNFECLAYYERIGDRAHAAGVYHNIAICYQDAGKKEEAVNYYKKALEINLTTGKKDWLGRNYLMLAGYYSEINNIDEALKCYEGARETFLALGIRGTYAYTLVGVGAQMSRKGMYAQAIDTLHRALSIFREIKDKNGVAWSFNNLGASYTQQRKFKEAAVYLDSCFRLCKELNTTEAMRNIYQRLYQLDTASGNLSQAYLHYYQYIAARDSMKNSENVAKVSNQFLRFEYSKKEEQAKAEQDKKEAVQTTTRNALIAGLALVAMLAFVLYNRFRLKKKANEIITYEKDRSENLLLNILPAEVAEELKSTGTASAKHFDNVTVLFTDFKNFTSVSQQLSPQELVDELHACFKGFDEICTKYSIEKIKTIGDAYLAVSGLPLADENHAENVVNAALEIREFMHKRRDNLGAKTFEIRIGINSGSVVAGIVGVKKFAYDIWGDTVNTAARMEQNSEAGKINISEPTYTLVKDRFTCEYRGEIDAKNKGKLKMYFVEKV